MHSFKQILITIGILIGIGIVLYYFPNFMKQLFSFYIPLFGLITIAVILAAIVIKIRKSRQ